MCIWQSLISSLRKGQRSPTPSRRPRSLTRLTRLEPRPAPTRRPSGRRTPSLPCRLLSGGLWSPLLGVTDVGPMVALQLISNSSLFFLAFVSPPTAHDCCVLLSVDVIICQRGNVFARILSVTCHQRATSCLAFFKHFPPEWGEKCNLILCVSRKTNVMFYCLTVANQCIVLFYAKY